MSTKKPVSDNGVSKPGFAPGRSRSRHVAILPHDALEKTDAVVAAVSSDLRASSAKTSELMLRSLGAVSMTRKLIAGSREAIKSSRLLLGYKDPSYRIVARGVVDTGAPAKKRTERD